MLKTLTINEPGVYVLRGVLGLSTSRPEWTENYFLMHVVGVSPFLQIHKVIKLDSLEEIRGSTFLHADGFFSIKHNSETYSYYSTKCFAKLNPEDFKND
jgi:hypothetical protein